MAQVGTLTVDLIAQTASFNSNIQKAAANLNANATRMNRSIASLQTGFDKAAAAARGLSLLAAGAAFGTLAKQSLDFAASIGEVAQQVGVTARDLQVYRYAATQAGLTQEEMESGLRKLTVSLGQAALGAKKQGEVFAALGISVRDASGHVKTAGDVLPEIANRLERIKDPAQRAAVEVALFGRAGQKLDTILSGGQKGVEEYAKRAEELGLVLSDELVGAADEAADRMAELTTQMKVNFAGVVAQNATSILALANALATLTGQAIGFIAQYPRLTAALGGAALGARVGGLPGAIVGAGGGFLAGNSLANQSADQNMDPAFRARELRSAIANYDRAKAAERDQPIFRIRQGNTAGGVNEARAELQRQTQLTNKALALRNTDAPNLPVVDLPEFLAPSGSGASRRGPSGPSAEELAERERRRQEAFANDLARLDSDLLSARMDNLTDTTKLAELARNQVTLEMDREDAAVRSAVIGKDLTQAEADQLLEKQAQLRSERMFSINLEELARNAEDAFDLQSAANDNQRDILQAQENLALTQGERRTAALALLNLDRKEEELRLKHILNLALIGQASAAEAAAARQRLGQLDTIYGGREEAVRRDTEGPLEAYLRDINKTPEQINEAIEQIKVNGLQGITDGLIDAITGVRSLGDVFHSVANQIIADLLRIQIQKMLAGILGSAAGGGTGEPVNLLEGVPWLAGARAAGGPVSAGRPYLVGERGPELMIPSASGSVIPNHKLPTFRAPVARNDNGATHHWNISVSGPMSDREARRTGGQIASAASQRMAQIRRSGVAG